MNGKDIPELEFPAAGLLRRVRRIARLSQRGLARRAGVAASTIGRIEAGTIMPTLPAMVRLLAIANLRLAVVDIDGTLVTPLDDLDDLRDQAGRRLPSHVEIIRDPGPGEWYGDEWRGDWSRRPLVRPKATYHHPARPADDATTRYDAADWPTAFRRRRKRPRPDAR